MIGNRYFRVYLGENVDKERKLSNGLPQDSALAPLLFNLHISDLPNTRSTKFSYADDIALACRTKGLPQAEIIFTEDLGITKYQ
ncbi:hypothetical protein Trydic_g405 [Trypoxylus dichotomus]